MYGWVGVLRRRSWYGRRHGLCASNKCRSSSSAYCLDLVRLAEQSAGSPDHHLTCERRATAHRVGQRRARAGKFTASEVVFVGYQSHGGCGQTGKEFLDSWKYDHDHYLCCLLLPREVRAASFALRAFNVEVAQVKDVVSDKKLGEMRMQFWREAIDQAFKGAPPQHPVAEELAQAIHRHKLSKHWLIRLLDSREADLSTTMYLSTSDMEDYAERTFSSLLYLTLEVMGVKDVNADHAASHVGKAEGIVTVLRAVTYHRSRRAVLIPMDIIMRHDASQEDFLRANCTQAVKDSVFDFASLAHTHLLKARSLRSKLPVALNSSKVMLPATVCDSFLHRIQRAQFDPFDPKLLIRDPLLAYRLLWKAIRRVY